MRSGDVGLYFGGELPGGFGRNGGNGMLGSGFVRYIFRGMRIYFSQDHMCRVLKNFRECSICSVSEGLQSYLTTMKLCSESTKGV